MFASSAFPNEWHSLVILVCLPIIFFVSLRIVFLFRTHASWVTYFIRISAGLVLTVLTIAIALLFLTGTAIQLQSFFSIQYAVVLLLSSSITGLYLAYRTGRQFEPWVIRWTKRKTHRAGLQDKQTDIRAVHEELKGLEKLDIDLNREFSDARKNNSKYLGSTHDRTPIYIDRPTWKRSHVQIMGPPGSGKGIQAGVVLTQALSYGDAVFAFDPKRDEWAPSVLQAACERASFSFQYVDLNDPTPQLNPLLHASADEISEIFYAGFGLSRSGSDSDFYRLDDRKAARFAASLIKKKTLSLNEMNIESRRTANRELLQGARAFFSAFDEISELSCTQTHDGIDLSAPLRNGGCIYIVGSMRNDPVVILQKMILTRIIQLVEKTVERKRHCSIFLDEFKYLLSTITVNTLGSIRDKGCNILLSHQSLGDFANCGADISEAAVRTTVLDTTPIKWLYRPSDRDTAEWVANQTGKIVVATQSMNVDSNLELSESLSKSRTVGETQRNMYDLNTVMSLPSGCAICVGVGLPKLASISKIQVSKRNMHVSPATPRNDLEADLLRRIPVCVSESKPLHTTSYVSLFDREPRERLLRFLFEETWSHINLIHELLDELTNNQIESILSELKGNKLIRSHEVDTGYDTTDQVWGVGKLGVSYVQETFKIEESRPAFLKTAVNLVSIRHQLDLQHMRLKAERKGWISWQKVRSKPVNKLKAIPDAIATRPDQTVIAIEVERTVKDVARYSGILVAHLNARRLREWDEIYYLCPDSKTANRIRRIFDEITEAEHLGKLVVIGDDHKALFHVFSYEEDWT